MGMVRLPRDVNARTYLKTLDKTLCEKSLAEFVQRAWRHVEPSAPLVWNWHLDALCEHLEAIARGVDYDGEIYNRLLMNVPPGMMKSMLVNVFFPAWVWGPFGWPSARFICASYSQDLAIRDNVRMRRLIQSDWYQTHWGDRVQFTSDQNQKTRFENTASGWRQAVAAGSITGHRADFVLIDDPHSVEGADSELQRDTTIKWFREAVPTRLNDPETSRIIVIMQRLHEVDISGVILDGQLGYDYIMLPMEYDPDRACETRLGFVDPRTEKGELLFPARFSRIVVDRDKRTMGPYAVAGQFQQTPMPRGGGVIKDHWWQLWEKDEYPPIDFVLGSIDTAYTLKQENDPSAMTVWGVFHGDHAQRANRMQDRYGRSIELGEEANGAIPGVPHVVLMYAWTERLEFHELVKRVAETCEMMQVDRLLIENKATGISVEQEMRRSYGFKPWAVHLIDPKNQDKLARLYSVQHLFSEGMIWAPDKQWAEEVIRQCASFPKGAHDDLTDTTSQALRHMRECGLLERSEERLAEIDNSMAYANVKPLPALYNS